MKTSRVFAILAAAPALAACGLLDSTPSWADRRAELEHSRVVWASTGVETYRYRLRRLCFCPGAGELIIGVEGGVVVEARDASTDEPVPQEVLQYLETVEDLFDVIEWAIEREADRFQATYHPTLGYPTVIDLDPRREAIDDELYLEAGDLAVPPYARGPAQPAS